MPACSSAKVWGWVGADLVVGLVKAVLRLARLGEEPIRGKESTQVGRAEGGLMVVPRPKHRRGDGGEGGGVGRPAGGEEEETQGEPMTGIPHSGSNRNGEPSMGRSP